MVKIKKKYFAIVLALSLLIFSAIPLSLIVKADKPTKPTLEFSWNERSFTYSVQRVWEGESVVVDYSGTFSDTYETVSSVHNATTGTWTKGFHDIVHDANYSWVSNTTIIGNITIDMDFQVYQVNIDYGPNIKVIWIALKQGTLVMDNYFSSKIQNFSYYEEYTQNRENHWEIYNYSTGEWTDHGNTTDVISGEKTFTHIENRTRSPYYYHAYREMEFSMPLIMTIQLFTTETKDRIAWINMIRNFLIYEDLDSNAIFSVADQDSGGVPQISSSAEKVGTMTPWAYGGYGYYYEYLGGSGTASSSYGSYPTDKTINEIASQISFTPPTSISDASVNWGIEYPDFPTSVRFWDWENHFRTETNSSYAHSCPNDYSYDFDYIVGENFTNLDTTWEIGKITNASFYDVVQGYGLVIPQYNYFLSTFNIDEIDSKELTLPCDIFNFESNDTLVAQLSMGGQNKDNYTLYDFPTTGVETEFNSQGGSVHPMVVAFDELSAHYEDPIINILYTLKDIVGQDPTFNIADSLYRLQTQNYPVWSGERLRHDPTLTVFYDSYEEVPTDGRSDVIFGFNYAILIGATGIITLVIVLEKRKKILK